MDTSNYRENDYDRYEDETAEGAASEKGSSRRFLWIIVMMIGILAVLAGALLAVIKWRRDKASMEAMQELQSVVEAIPEEEDSSETVEAEVPEEEPLPENPIDFDALRERNSDIYAWIRIEDTQIDYPVLQCAEDDAFYLTHDVDRNTSSHGAIYTETVNSKEFSDPVTLMYGHNMRDGSMFQNVHKFEDLSFFETHEFLHVFVPGHDLTYRILSVYNYDDRHILNSFDFSDPAVYESYLDEIFHKYIYSGHVREDMEVTAEDRILILSTCVGNRPDQRCLLTAVLVEDQETADYTGQDDKLLTGIEGTAETAGAEEDAASGE